MADNTLSCQRETLHSQQLRSIKKSIDSDHGIYRAPANPGGVVTGGIKRAAGVIAGHEPCGVVAAAGHRHRAVQGVRGLACPFLGGRRATPARHAMLIAFNVSASGVRIRSGRCHRTSS